MAAQWPLTGIREKADQVWALRKPPLQYALDLDEPCETCDGDDEGALTVDEAKRLASLLEDVARAIESAKDVEDSDD